MTEFHKKELYVDAFRPHILIMSITCLKTREKLTKLWGNYISDSKAEYDSNYYILSINLLYKILTEQRHIIDFERWKQLMLLGA